MNPRVLSHPRLARTIYYRPRSPRRSRFLRRSRSGTFFSVFFLAADVTAVFPPSFLVFVPLILKSSFSFYSFAVPRLDRFCLSGTHEARGACNCARHISPTGRGKALHEEWREEVDVYALKRRRVYYDFGVTSSFFFRFLFSLFPSLFFLFVSLFLSPFSSSLCYEHSW